MELYKKPYALSSPDWEDWYEKTRAQFPIQYFIREDVVDFFGMIYYRLRDIKWWILHRIHPKHRYHVIKPKSLTPGYHDYDTLMFHACFDLLVQYVETHVIGQEWTQKDVDEATEDEGKEILAEQLKNQTEALSLYHWWKDRLNREDVWDDLPKLTREQRKAFWSGDHSNPAVIEYRDGIQRMIDREQEWDAEDLKTFHRLVDIYRTLWY